LCILGRYQTHVRTIGYSHSKQEEPSMTESLSNLQAVVLGLIQGFTEFLPISSSGHLALVPLISSWPDQGLAYDCVLHLGTLTAVVYYFRSDLAKMSMGFSTTIQQRSWSNNPDGKMAWFLLLSTIPVGILGLLFKDFVEQDLRSVVIVGVSSIVFGVLLWFADKKGIRTRSQHDWTLKDAMIVGLAQAVALIPGTSRSGITMTAGLFLGYTREASARFSFLLSIPVIVLAGGLKVKDWFESTTQTASFNELIIGYLVSAVSAYFCIHYFLKFLDRVGMGPFVIYRILLGAVLLWLVW